MGKILILWNVLCYKDFINYMIENRVAIYMAIKRLDKRDIVRMTGIDRHTLNNIFKCKTKGIEFETLNKLCFALDCTLNDLFRSG